MDLSHLPPVSRLTIQINSLEALERLIGGDSAVEIELRNNIAAKFVEKHLKQLAGTGVIQTAIQNARTAVLHQAGEELKKTIGSWSQDWRGQLSNITLRAEIVEKIKGEIDMHVSDLITRRVQDAMTAADLEGKVAKRVADITEYRINEMVRAKLDSVVKGLKG